MSHAWNAVFLGGFWRLLDCTWGAGKVEEDGTFIKELNEHFFLTDPDELIYTHFPYDEVSSCQSYLAFGDPTFIYRERHNIAPSLLRKSN